MEQTNSIASANERLARQINQEARQNPKSPYVGKLVGIANGQVVVVGDSWREVAQRLRQVEPDPMKCYCIEASADYERVEEIWSQPSPEMNRSSVKKSSTLTIHRARPKTWV